MSNQIWRFSSAAAATRDFACQKGRHHWWNELVIGLSAYRHILFDKLVDANREITAAIRPNRQILSSLKISANGVAALDVSVTQPRWG
jgi:hypothetical protein